MNELLRAAGISLSLPLVSFALALLWVPLFVWGLRKGEPLTRGVVSFFRSTPLVAQLFLAYYGLPEFSLVKDLPLLWAIFGQAFPCAVFVFALNGGAHLAYHFSVLSLSLDRELWPSAHALHFSKLRYWLYLAGPRAVALSQPILRQELIQLFKAGSICSLVALQDFASLSKSHLTNTFDPFGAYAMALAFYFLGVTLIQRFWKIPKPD